MATVRDATYELLRSHGLTTVFGNPGSTELGFLRDFPADFRYVLALHEGVAVGMADGFAQASGRPTFVNLHSACGVGNAMGAVVNAFHNRAPLVITAGNQDRRHLASEPYLFARSKELMAPYVKRSDEPARAADVPGAIERAWHLALTPPAGPVFVSVPVDDWDAEAPQPRSHAVRAGGRADGAALDALTALVERSERPALVAGAGIDRDGAWAAAVRLAERLCAPVWAAPQAPRAGFPEDHALFQGHLAAGHASATRQLAGADLALVLGAPAFAFLPYEPGGALPPLAHVTDDPDEAARAPAALSLVAAVGDVMERLLERLAPRSAPWPARRPAPPVPPATSPITPAYLMAALGAAVPAGAVIVEESPSNRAELRRHVPIRRPASFFATASGGLGFAMPAAVGVKLADPSRTVVCLVGDGSALYGPQALWNAVQLGLGVVFVVVDNGRYAILDAVAQFGGLSDVPGLALPGLDFLALARSFGCRALRIADPERLPGALADALAGDGPVVLDVVIDPAAPPLLPPSPHQETP
jgi:benzoylformate decarboxylase